MNYKSQSDLEKIYAKCKYKGFGRDGRPRPCRNARCPCPACRSKGAEKNAAINRRSAQEKPPNFSFVLRVEDKAPFTDEQLDAYVDRLVEKFKYHRKSRAITLEYESRLHFKRGRPHIHLTIITSADWSVRKAKALMKAWWHKSCSGRKDSVYADKIRDPIAHIRYVTGDVLDRSKCERPPREWGKKFRLIRRSNGFLIRPAAALWIEHWEERYPKPEPDGGNDGRSRCLSDGSTVGRCELARSGPGFRDSRHPPQGLLASGKAERVCPAGVVKRGGGKVPSASGASAPSRFGIRGRSADGPLIRSFEMEPEESARMSSSPPSLAPPEQHLVVVPDVLRPDGVPGYGHRVADSQFEDADVEEDAVIRADGLGSGLG